VGFLGKTGLQGTRGPRDGKTRCAQHGAGNAAQKTRCRRILQRTRRSFPPKPAARSWPSAPAPQPPAPLPAGGDVLHIGCGFATHAASRAVVISGQRLSAPAVPQPSPQGNAASARDLEPVVEKQTLDLWKPSLRWRKALPARSKFVRCSNPLLHGLRASGRDTPLAALSRPLGTRPIVSNLSSSTAAPPLSARFARRLVLWMVLGWFGVHPGTPYPVHGGPRTGFQAGRGPLVDPVPSSGSANRFQRHSRGPARSDRSR